MKTNKKIIIKELQTITKKIEKQGRYPTIKESREIWELCKKVKLTKNEFCKYTKSITITGDMFYDFYKLI